MSEKATLVVKFGQGASSGFVAAEFDDIKNVDTAGKTKSSFAPGEEPYFLVQHDDSLRIDRIAATGGMVVAMGLVSRPHSDRLDFPALGDTAELSHLPAGSVARSWVDHAAAVTISGRTVTAAGGELPAKGDLAYDAEMHSFRLVPPPMTLAAGETHEITIYIFMETAS